jgi:cytochrome P450
MPAFASNFYLNFFDVNRIYEMYASYVAAAALAYFITSRFLLCMRRRRLIVQYACQPFQSRYPHKDLFLGIGLFVKVQRKFQTHGFCDFLTGLGRRHGTTYQTYFLGTTTVQTIDTENIKTVLATKFDDWEITPGRIDSLSTLLGKGIFTTNGLDWRRSRKLVTPNLAREQYKDLGLYDRHLNRLINRIPSDGQTVVDLQDLFLDFTMDTTTELLMGHSVDSQVNLDGVTGEFSTAYETAKDHGFKNLRNPTFAWLQDQRPLFSAVRIVHALVDRFIEQASSSLRTQASEDSKLQRYNLLNEMMSLTDDRTQIRSEILNLLLAGRDSTASTLANLFFVLARQPEVEKKLREEVDRLQGSRPSFELLKAMKYLRWCFNEGANLTIQQ